MDNARKVEKDDVLATMRTQSGRNFINRIIETTNAYGSAFDKDSRTHAFNEGMRQVGLALIDELIESAPEEYKRMLTENLSND